MPGLGSMRRASRSVGRERGFMSGVISRQGLSARSGGAARRRGGGLVRPGLLASTALAAAGWVMMTPATAQADVFTASTFAELAAAIAAANATAGADTITVTADITLAGMLPAITGATTIAGGNFTISGADLHRLFFVDAPGQSVSFTDLTLANGLA